MPARLWSSSILSFLFFLFLGRALADPSLPHLIGDHAVLQRGQEIHIWGQANPSEPIRVTLAGQSSATRADAVGHWSVHLPPMNAGGPFVLHIVGKTAIEVKDVMIGEVWIASGQSNMTFELSGSTGSEEELPMADYPDIRLFTVPRRVTLRPQADTLPAAWQLCSPDSAKRFSAVAYYFARDLYRKLHVPIGIIESAWPGTAIEEWTPPEAGQRDPGVNNLLEEFNDRQARGYNDGRLPFLLEFDDFELIPVSGSSAHILPLSDFDQARGTTPWGGYWKYDFGEAPDTAFELAAPGHGASGFAARVSGSIDASDDTRLELRYRSDGTAQDFSPYSGIRFWVRGDGQFRFRSLQPTISDWDDYSSQLSQATPDWKPVTISFADLRQDGWGVPKDFSLNALTGFVLECLPKSGYPLRPSSGLYQGMMAALMPYKFRGVIWYQGESNALEARDYGHLLPALIQGWRVASHQSDMSFLIVQLPNHGAIPTEPGESAWAELREAQLQTAKTVPNTGMAVTIDVGDPNDLHPHRKAEVGARLATYALGTTYQQPVVPSGPLFESSMVQGVTIQLRFKFTGSGLQSRGGDLRGFAIAGPDRKFHWAAAQIEGDMVVVSSPEVKTPVAVRYGWGDSPECNLYNFEGLPASPFRTDDWGR